LSEDLSRLYILVVYTIGDESAKSVMLTFDSSILAKHSSALLECSKAGIHLGDTLNYIDYGIVAMKLAWSEARSQLNTKIGVLKKALQGTIRGGVGRGGREGL